METIRNYLDNMFAGLPKTARVTDLKNNILSNMEEKYNELKKQGKSENEAIGIVISEFGNIDELIHELGIHKDERTMTQPLVNRDEVEAYLNAKKKAGFQVAAGVFLCIMAAAVLILFSYLFDSIASAGPTQDLGETLGVVILLIMVAIAVGIFIYSGMQFEKYKYIDAGVQLPGSLEAELKQRYEQSTPSFYLNIIVGVCLIILSPISIFIPYLIYGDTNEVGVIGLLILVAISVFLFITAGTKREGYQRLLQIEDYSPQKKEEDKVIGAVASIVWPLAVVIFLVAGLVYEKWSTCWIVFPITGILFGMFCAAYSIIKGDKQTQ